MNKEDRVQFERELVRVSQAQDEASRAGKKKSEAHHREELHQLMRHLNG